MATGKQNNISSGLEGLDYIPEGFTFNQNGTWKRINSRMTSKSRRRLVLYAAILTPFIVAVILYMYDGGKNHHNLVVITKPAEQLVIIPKQNSVAKKKMSTQNAAKALPVRNQKEATIIARNQIETDKMIQPLIVEPAIEIVPGPIDTASVAVVPKSRYKYKIVHINEIDEIPTQSSTAVVKKSLKKPFLATMSETSNVNESRLVHEKKRIVPFLTVSSQ